MSELSSLESLIEKEFIGTILGEPDPKQMGRYKVHIPEIMQHLSEDKGIWCKNQVHSWRITPSDDGEYGSYYPLHSGTKVIVKFYSNDYSSGYIDRIISDADENTDNEAQDSRTVKPSSIDRDEQYIIFKTPKKFNIFYANEDTEKEPNTIYLIYNRDENPERRTVYRIDESGIHIWTRDNRRIRVKLDENKQIDGDKSLFVKQNRKSNIAENEDLAVGGSRTVNILQDEDKIVYRDRRENVHGEHHLTSVGNKIENVESNDDHSVGGNMTIEVQGNCDISVVGICNIYSDTAVNIDSGGSVNIQSGIASKKSANISKIAEDAQSKTEVIDLGPKETEEYETGVGEKCDDVTKPDGGYGSINE